MAADTLGLHTSRWETAPRDRDAEQRLARTLGVSPIFAAVLARRGMTNPDDARRFMRPSLDALYDPWLLPDIALAVERIVAALDKRERILVHGDYDADGVTAVALLVRMFRELDAVVEYHVPDRADEGYGLSRRTVAAKADEGVTLIITVDSRPTEEGVLEEARQRGVDLIVTDHHPLYDGQPGERTVAGAGGLTARTMFVVNPRRQDSEYPNSDLSGVGVAFKLGAALMERLRRPVSSYRREFLDLVAVGTIADVSPLTGENRALVSKGLELLPRTNNVGLRALMRVCRIGATVDAEAVGFRIGPRLNAAGRMRHASYAVELLLTDDERDAARCAEELDEINRERQGRQAEIVRDAWAQLERQGDLSKTRAIVLSSEEWHLGIVGIAAAKLVDGSRRPTVLLNVEDGIARGSARSIPAFNVTEALHECREHLLRYGGHPAAAGLALDVANLAAFRNAFCAVAEREIADEDMAPTHLIDCEVAVDELTLDLAEEIARLEPFGAGNPEPILLARDLRVRGCRCVGASGNHLKLAVGDDRSAIDAIGFGLGDRADEVADHGFIDACFAPQVNEWNNARSLQLRLVDIRPVQHSVSSRRNTEGPPSA